MNSATLTLDPIKRINLEDLFAENKYGKSGGLGFSTKRGNARYFLDFP